MTLFIVAELSANHLGSLERALAIVDAAADAGADAIKLQTWAPGTMCVDPSIVLKRGPWVGRRMVDLYAEAHTPWEWHQPIFHAARRRGMIPFSAAFDRESVDFLERLGVDRHKVASFELTDLPLIRYMASKGKPMILSTGMATGAEVSAAIDACDVIGGRCPSITLLRCTSAYPASPVSANLRGAAREFGAAFGLSDHSQGIGVAVAAVALGATYIEKHLTLARADGGPDAGFSMEPAEFAQMVTECRRAAAAMGGANYGPHPGEDPSLRRGLWVVRDIAKGEPLRFGDNVNTARPCRGLPPSFDLTGRRAAAAITAPAALMAEMLA